MKMLLLFISLAMPATLIAESDHDHSKGERAAEKAEAGHDEHGDESHHEEAGHEEEGSSSVGPDKAVTAAEEAKGIRFSDKARAAINIRTEKVGASGKVPPSALLKSGDETFVYWFRDGWFKRIRPSAVDAGDEVVVEGVALLRVAELDAFTAGEVGHAH